MLRNVAIPLMLAASEAEAAPTAAELKRAMAQDVVKDVPILIADKVACTSGSAAATIGAAETDVKTKNKAVTDAQAELAALRKPTTGTWTVANEARKAAVAAAVAKEDSTDIKTKLDTLDAKAELEKLAAEAYFVAKRKFDAGKKLVQTTTADEGTVNGEEARLKGLKTAADTAVKDTGSAILEEQTTLKWLYCELGSIPLATTCGISDTACKAKLAADTRMTAYIAAKAAAPGIVYWWNGTGVTGAANPKNCIVPAVVNASNVQQRQAITYYTAKGSVSGQLKAETQTSKFNRTLAVTEANIALTVTTSTTATGKARFPDGDVSWLEGNAVKYQWLVHQRTREAAFYDYVNKQIVLAKGWATKMATDAVYVIPANTTENYKLFRYAIKDLKTAGIDTRYNVGQPSAKKLLDTALTARDLATESGGSGYKMGGVKRAQAAVTFRKYLTVWTRHTGNVAGTAAVKTWVQAQKGYTAKAKQYTWWLLARDASAKNKIWNTAMYATTTAAGSDLVSDLANRTYFSAPVATEVKDTATSRPCDETNGKKCADCAWANVSTLPVTGASITDGDKCYNACQEYNYGTNGIAIKSGTYYGPRTTAAAKVCTAASFTTSSKACNLLTVAPAKIVALGTPDKAAADKLLTALMLPAKSTSVAGKCQTVVSVAFTKTPADTNATIARWAALWNDWYLKYKLAMPTVTAYTDMANDAKAQATKEQTWMNAWYFQQFWAKMETQLDKTTTGSRAKDFTTWHTGALGAGTADTKDTSKDGSTASQTANTTKLENARNKLAMLQSKLNAAKTAKTLVETQILNTTEQIADMQAQVKVRSGLGTVASPLVLGGELAELATKRQADYDVYGKATTGKKAVALKAKNDAIAAVAAGTGTTGAGGTTWSGEGALKQDDRLKNEAWTAAKKAVVDAKKAVDDAVGKTTTVAQLRQAVIDKTALWDTQQGKLDTAIKKVADAEAAELKSTKALAATVLLCQTKAFDAYKDTLDKAVIARNAKLDTIEKLLKGQTKPAAGAIGARCEKALSNGTFRPKRDEFGGCGEGNCCGAARVWMVAGVTTDAAWRTIETCQKADLKKYAYQPPRAPLATTMPTTVEVDFACITGAKTLAAAASAVAAAVYMLA